MSLVPSRHGSNRRSVLLSFLMAGGLSLVGCGMDDQSDPGGVTADQGVSQIQGALRNCPDPPCDPPNPPPPPPPPPPNQKTALIPTSYISNQMNLFLLDTKIQVTHTSGDPLIYPSFAATGCHEDTPAANACIQEVCDDLIGKERALCVAACRRQHQICDRVCSSRSAMTYMRWGALAKELSRQKHPDTCSTTTCPACATPTAVPSLRDEIFSVDAYKKSVDLGPVHLFTITCSVNRWQFLVTFGSLNVVSGGSGIAVHVPGLAGSPAIICENGPDLSVSGLGLALTFHPSVTNGVLKVSAEGGLDGSFDSSWPIDWLVDFDAKIKAGVQGQLGGTLNGGTKPAQYADLFNGLIAQYLSANNLPPVVSLKSVTTNGSGLLVKYQ